MKVACVLFTQALGIIWAPIVSAEGIGETAQTYEVRPRDRFETLSERFGVTPGEIRAANPGKYGTICGNPHNVTLSDGTVRAICGRPRYYLIAGKTLVITSPRFLIESENVRLDAENTALEAEAEKIRAEMDSLARERDALRAERDRLSAEKDEIFNAKQELQNRYDELERAWTVPQTSRVQTSPGSKPAPAPAYDRGGFLVVICVLLAGSLLVGMFILYRKYVGGSEKRAAALAEKTEKELGELEEKQQAMIRKGLDLADRRSRLEADERESLRTRSALEKEQEQMRVQRGHFGRWEESLKDRENRLARVVEGPRVATVIGVPPIFPPVPTSAEFGKAKTEAGLLFTLVGRGRQLLEDGLTVLVGREVACNRREEELQHRTEELSNLQSRLTEREAELTKSESNTAELQDALGKRGRFYDQVDAEQADRKETLDRAFADLAAQREALGREIGERRAELDRRESEIDGKIRMYDEDIAPLVQGLARREETVAARERAVAEQSEESDRRARSIDSEERDYERRLTELQNLSSHLDTRAERITFSEADLNARETTLINERREVEALRDGLEADLVNFQKEQRELDSAKEALQKEIAEAKSVLSRAKRKKEISAALETREAEIVRREGACETREAEIVRREGACETREGSLEVWEARLNDREMKSGLDNLPKSGLPHRQTLAPLAPMLLQQAAAGLRGNADADSGDEESTTLSLTCSAADAVDPCGTTHIDPPGSEPIMEVSKCLCPICNLEIPIGIMDEHLAKAHADGEEDADRQATDLHVPLAAEPASLRTSLFWCTLCGRDMPMAEMEAHHALHRAQDKPGPLGLNT